MRTKNDFQLLVVTMNQTSFDLIEKMKIDSDAIISNQCDCSVVHKKQFKDNEILIINNETKGVGKNRNFGLLYAEADICLFSDDDVIYRPNYKNIILKAFEEKPDADVIIFNVQTIGENLGRRVNTKISKVNYSNFLNYGAVRIAFRLNKIKANNIWFTTLFGGGCIYNSGEDTLFLRDCLKHKLNIYTYPETIADVMQIQSSWFRGYDEKYYYDKGALCAAAFSKTKYFIALLLVLKAKNQGDLKLIKKILLILNGVKGYKNLNTYQSYIEKGK